MSEIQLRSFALSYSQDSKFLSIIGTTEHGGKCEILIHDLELLVHVLTDFLQRTAAGTLLDDSDAAAVYEMTDLDCGNDLVPPVSP